MGKFMGDKDDLKRVIAYNPLTGDFTWTVGRPGVRMGTIAGGMTSEGYRQVTISRNSYLAHRLAWFFITGEWPNGEIDHINGIRHDNRASNLRVVDRAENSQNRRRAQANNISCGLLGVSWNHQHRKWRAKITTNKITLHIGYFADPDSAHAAYLKAKKKLHIDGGCH